MLLTITTTQKPATDLGYLLHKNPARVHESELPFGRVVMFYPEAGPERATFAMLLDIDPVALVRGRGGPGSHSSAKTQLAEHYVSDRAYAASSFLSVAMARTLRSALAGQSKERPELAARALPLSARVLPLPVRGSEGLVERLFVPLGYKVVVEPIGLDETWPEWGASPYVALTLSATCRLADLLSHLYVLIPVLDRKKHYYVDRQEIDKLIANGAGWLSAHPERALIAQRYLHRQPSLAREALARLDEDAADDAADGGGVDVGDLSGGLAQGSPSPLGAEGRGEGAGRAGASEGTPPHPSLLPRGEKERELSVQSASTAADPAEPGRQSAKDAAEAAIEAPMRLHDQRLDRVVTVLKEAGARRVVDLGCGSGKLLSRLVDDRFFTDIVGIDASIAALEIAARRLKLERMNERQRARITIAQGALTYRDRRIEGYDAVALVEVVEHLDPDRLASLERVVFEFSRAPVVVVTTPNREYNALFSGMEPGALRHADHRFEWTREELATWAGAVAERFGFTVDIAGIGAADERLGAPSQLAVFTRTRSPGAVVAACADAAAPGASSRLPA